jgi:hypothetical protein
VGYFVSVHADFHIHNRNLVCVHFELTSLKVKTDSIADQYCEPRFDTGWLGYDTKRVATHKKGSQTKTYRKRCN